MEKQLNNIESNEIAQHKTLAGQPANEQAMPQKKGNAPAKPQRECGMMGIAGGQGVGKTYQNMHLIKDYSQDNLVTKVRGRKVLIFDTNGEYVPTQFARNGIPNFEVKTIKVKDIESWGLSEVTEVRRIDAKMLGMKEKQKIVEHIIKVYRNGMFVLEDINNYILNATQMAEVVSGLINLRHRGVDVLVSYQRLRAIEPVIYANSRWFRLHYQLDNVDNVKGKLPNDEIFKIASLIVAKKYNEGDKRFFLYITNLSTKIEGKFTKRDFAIACQTYLGQHKKKIKDCMSQNGVDHNTAIMIKIKEYYKLYINN